MARSKELKDALNHAYAIAVRIELEEELKAAELAEKERIKREAEKAEINRTLNIYAYTVIPEKYVSMYGIVFADTEEDAIEKLKKEYPAAIESNKYNIKPVEYENDVFVVGYHCE